MRDSILCHSSWSSGLVTGCVRIQSRSWYSACHDSRWYHLLNLSRNSSSRWRLLWRNLRNYAYAYSCHLAFDHCQHSSWFTGSCQPSRCQRYFLGHSYDAGFELYYSHFLPKGIPQSPRCDVQTWPILHGWWMVGFVVQLYLHIVDALYLCPVLVADWVPSDETKYELCFCKVLVLLFFTLHWLIFHIPFFKVIALGVVVFAQ